MEPRRARVTLDDPELSGRLRYTRREPSFVRRPVEHHSSHSLDPNLLADIKPAKVKPARTNLSQPSPPSLSSERVHQRTARPLPESAQIHRQARQPHGSTGASDARNEEISYQPTLLASSVGESAGSRISKLPARTRQIPRSLVIGIKQLEHLARLVKSLSWKPASLYAAAAVLFAVGIYVGVGGWQANHQVAAQADHLQKIVNKSVPSSNTSSAVATAPSNPPVPSTKPISTNTIANYQVASDLPRYLIIPKIHVYARVLQTGITTSGALGTPPNIYDTAWYNGSAKPGAPGATLIDGHLDGEYSAGVFWNLHKLAPGDQIHIQKGDGSAINYKVVKVQAFDANDPNMMASALVPITPGQPGLNLITCNGNYQVEGGYNQRLVVYATED